jgi:hypothetical protein
VLQRPLQAEEVDLRPRRGRLQDEAAGADADLDLDGGGAPEDRLEPDAAVDLSRQELQAREESRIGCRGLDRRSLRRGVR